LTIDDLLTIGRLPDCAIRLVIVALVNRAIVGITIVDWFSEVAAKGR
jgi:hypothetical protein